MFNNLVVGTLILDMAHHGTGFRLLRSGQIYWKNKTLQGKSKCRPLVVQHAEASSISRRCIPLTLHLVFDLEGIRYWG